MRPNPANGTFPLTARTLLTNLVYPAGSSDDVELGLGFAKISHTSALGSTGGLCQELRHNPQLLTHFHPVCLRTLPRTAEFVQSMGPPGGLGYPVHGTWTGVPQPMGRPPHGLGYPNPSGGPMDCTNSAVRGKLHKHTG